MKILVASLDPLLSERVRDAAPGLEVLQVEDAFDALEALRADPFELAVVDLLVRGMDGLELLGALRDLSLPPQVLAVCPLPGTAMRAVRMGADVAVDRPLPPGKLERAVAQLLEATRSSG